jgi:RNA polymerase sigma-70 factor, ECF subfamily
VQLSDQQFIESLRKSDEQAFGQVFREYYPRLCSYACNLLNDMDEAEEIVQQTFLTIWEKRLVINITTSFKAYLYRAVQNSCLNKFKREKVRQSYAEDHIKVTSPVYEHTSDMVLGMELEKKLQLAIESLPEQCRLVFKLSRYEDLKYAEIADQLGISAKTVENHIGKALKILRQHLKDYLPTIIFVLSGLININ